VLLVVRRQKHLGHAVTAVQGAVGAALGAGAATRQPPHGDVPTAVRLTAARAPLRVDLDPDWVGGSPPKDPPERHHILMLELVFEKRH
jgi:hypothetical protein